MTAISVIGLGKLGTCLAALLAQRGNSVIGFDVDESVVERVNAGKSPVSETGLQAVISEVGANLTATTDPCEAVSNSDIAFLVVPTPSDDDGRFSNRHIFEALDLMGPALTEREAWFTVVICSTVMPGSTSGPIKDYLQGVSGKIVGEDVGLAYSPEFIALGSVIHDMTHPDMVMIGTDDLTSRTRTWEAIEDLPSDNTPFLFMSTVDAEIAKIAVNTYVTMKISYANTIGEICERTPGSNATEVIRAIGSDSRIGPKYLQPGGAYGGPCFPRDTFAFSAVARECGTRADLAEATDTINMRQSVRIADEFAKFNKVAVLGKSYKPFTPVTERSFASDLIQLLQIDGVRVIAYDPMVSIDLHGCSTAVSAQDAVDQSEAVIIATAYPSFVEVNFGERPVLDVWSMLPDGPNIWRVGSDRPVFG